TLLDGAIDDHDDAIRFLSIIARQAERLEAIIEDLLALSRIERIEESSDLSLENIALSEVITAAIGSCQLRASERAIDVTVDCDPRVQVAVNPPLFEQALINLIDNAIKYSDTGKTVRLQVGSTQGPSAQTNSITISVADEGCGIDPQFLPRIFERFYRVDRARSRKLGGTGLGLSIVKHIVQAHGGSVDVHSTPGVGSVFSIHLPIDEHATTGSGRSPLTRA
ncbi:PAS domain-containing sensor histidine kinase, partial [bacterium]|nr:PAS domain-containing sensor histidine kinase [bacterium]